MAVTQGSVFLLWNNLLSVERTHTSDLTDFLHQRARSDHILCFSEKSTYSFYLHLKSSCFVSPYFFFQLKVSCKPSFSMVCPAAPHFTRMLQNVWTTSLHTACYFKMLHTDYYPMFQHLISCCSTPQHANTHWLNCNTLKCLLHIISIR